MGLLDVVQEQPDGVHEFPVHGGIQKQESPCYLFHGMPEQQCLKKEKHGIVRKVGPQPFFRQLGKIADKHGKIGDVHAEGRAFHFPHECHVPEQLESVAYEQGLKHGISFRRISVRKISCHGIENKRDNQSSQQTT